jgi:heme/copper-type cytochrome/quinol oxidase subunit 2
MISVRPGRYAGRWAAFVSAVLLTTIAALRDHGARLAARAKAEPDAGYSTEFVVITAAIVAIAIAVVAALGKKIMDKINGLNL